MSEQTFKFKGFRLYCVDCEKVFHEMKQSIVYHNLNRLKAPEWWKNALLHWKDTEHQIMMEDPLLGLMDFPKKCAEDMGTTKQQLLERLRGK